MINNMMNTYKYRVLANFCKIREAYTVRVRQTVFIIGHRVAVQLLRLWRNFDRLSKYCVKCDDITESGECDPQPCPNSTGVDATLERDWQ